MAQKKTQRADGRYQGKLLVGVTDGKPKYRYVYGKTQKEVNDKLAALRVELGQGVDLTQDRALSYWIDRWLRRTEQTQEPGWHATCEARANVWRDRLGRMPVDKITPADLEDVLLDLAKENPVTHKPTAKKTLVEYRNIISRVYAFIIQNRVVTFDPTEHLTVSREAKKEQRHAITDEQIEKILSTPHRTQLPCLVMLYAGLRLGEMCALTWSDIDFDNNLIFVNKSFSFQTQRVKGTKTAAGERRVPLTDPLRAALLEAPRTALLVCPASDGSWYTRSAWRNAAEQYGKALGFPVEAHCLRHTYATLLYEAGVDVLTAQRWMGHADPQTTMKIYTHLRDQHEADAVQKFTFFVNRVSKGCQNPKEAL